MSQRAFAIAVNKETQYNGNKLPEAIPNIIVLQWIVITVGKFNIKLPITDRRTSRPSVSLSFVFGTKNSSLDSQAG
jgi:hypothetical protein